MSQRLHEDDDSYPKGPRSRHQHKLTSPIPIPPRADTVMGLRWIHGSTKDVYAKDGLFTSRTSRTSPTFTYITLRQGASEMVLDQRVKDIGRILRRHGTDELGCKYYNKFHTSTESYIVIEGRVKSRLIKAILDLDFIVSCNGESPWPYDDGGEPRPYKKFRDRGKEFDMKDGQ